MTKTQNGENVQHRAVVVVIPEWPTKGTGGPLGFSYLLLRAILELDTRNFDLYLAATSCNEAVRLDSLHELDGLIATGQTARTSLRGKAIQYLFCKLPYSRSRVLRNGFAQLRQWRRKGHQARLYRLLAPIAHSHSQVVVHIHDVETGAKAVAACRSLPNVSLVHTEHGKGGLMNEYLNMLGSTDESDRMLVWLRTQYEALLTFASAVTFPSDGAMKLFEEAAPALLSTIIEKSVVIRTGIPTVQPARGNATRDRDCKQLFAIAQHVPEKGIDRMLQALKVCKENGVRLQLKVAGGETVKSQDLYRLRDELGLQQEVVFLGAVTHAQVMQELRECDLYLACPRVVVFDLSLLEAMAVGVPIITSKLPGNIEALGAQYDGYFSSDAELPAVIQSLVSDPERSAKMAARNRSRCEAEFTLDKMVSQYIKLYSHVGDGQFAAGKWRGATGTEDVNC